MEQVLCIDRSRLPLAWVSRKSVVPMDFQTFSTQCTQSGYFFEDRRSAEQDQTKKQIIPYVLLQTRSFGKTAVYLRKGREERLHDLWSIGIGGHVNPLDQTGTSFKEILMAGMYRELDEELIRRPTADPVRFLGVISEDVTPVGSVHLGAVFSITTLTPEGYGPGPELHRFQWKNTGELDGLHLELWSELALELAAAQG